MEAVFISNPGYDALTGLNSGDLGFQSLQGYLNNKNYYAPVPFNPNVAGGPDAPGYIDFGSSYDPAPGSPGSSDYLYYGNYGEALGALNPGGKQVSYGSAQTNSLAGTPGNGDPMLNGIDYTQGASYANQFAQGQGTVNQNYGGYSASDFGQRSQPSPLVPYTQYTEPGYKSPQYSQAATSGTQSYGQNGQPIQSPGNQATFLYGNNGDLGSISGTLSNTTPGQSSQFYSNGAANISPALTALSLSRSQNK